MPIILPSPKIQWRTIKKGSVPCVRSVMSRASTSPGKSGRLYPSGCFTIGFVPRSQSSKKDLTYQAECDTWDLLHQVVYNKPGGTHSRIWVKTRDLPRFIDTPYLGKTRSSRGSKGLTNHGKRYVRESCYLLERRYGVKRLGFYTLTIPSCTAVTLYDVALHWTSIQKYFFKLLRNTLYAKGIKEFFYVGVTENQSDRSLRAQAPAYHLHFIMPCYLPNSTNFIVSADTLRALWARALRNYLPEFGGVDFSASVDSAVLRKSAAGYLSKYFTKGSSLRELHPACLPASWYYSSREIKAWYKKSLLKLSSNQCDIILEVITDASFVKFWDFVCTPDSSGDREVIRGYYGSLHNEFGDYLRASPR